VQRTHSCIAQRLANNQKTCATHLEVHRTDIFAEMHLSDPDGSESIPRIRGCSWSDFLMRIGANIYQLFGFKTMMGYSARLIFGAFMNRSSDFEFVLEASFGECERFE